MLKIMAFVARSFSPSDEAKIEPIIGFLESFRKSGFLPHTAEQADMESVSQRVRKLIDDSDVFVGIFTRRYRVYEPGALWRALIPPSLGGLKIERWVAPPWVIQESGYALKAIEAKRKIILFRETGVELPSLHGDLEYIEFDPKTFSSAFQKASEMINALLSEASGTVVETVVRTNPPPPEKSPETEPTRTENADKAGTESKDYFFELFDAIYSREWDKASHTYDKFLTSLREENSQQELFWKTWYHRQRYCAGQSADMEALEALVNNNPDRPEPLSAIGGCIGHFQEYENAADYYLRASRVADAAHRPFGLTSAANALNKAKKTDEAVDLLLDACRAGVSELGLRKELYSLLKERKDEYAAFAIAERTLQENPGAGDFRFSLAYDYDATGINDLSLFHYGILRETTPPY